MTTTKKTDKEIIEILEPEVLSKELVIGEGENKMVFTQKPLTFFGKIEFFSVAGTAVEKILGDGNTITDLLDTTDPNIPLDNSAAGIETFAKGIATIVKYVPEVLGDLFCVILNVNRGERDYVKLRLEEELTDEQGFGILETFVDQNWEVLQNFFSQGILPLYQKVQAKI